MHIQVNGSQANQVLHQPTVSNKATNLEELRRQLKIINEVYIKTFKDETYKSNLLSRKNISSLYSNVRQFFQHSSTEQRNEKKERLCCIFREFIIDLAQNFILDGLSKCEQDQQFIRCLIQKWGQFKRFCYLYVFLLKGAETHYQTCYKSYKSQAKPNKIESPDSIFPLPAVALHYFETIVYNCYKSEITRIVREMLCEERQGRIIDREALQTLFEIIYSNGLAELGRINADKNSFYFFPTQNKEIEKQYSNTNKNPDAAFFKNVLNLVIEDSAHYYTKLFHQSISGFGPHQDFETVWKILLKEQEIAENYLFNHAQKTAYLNKIKEIIVMTNLEQRLKRQNSFKHCLQRFNPDQNSYVEQIKLYIEILFKSKDQTLKIFLNIIQQYLLEACEKINEKINKRREHMLQMVALKKSINRLIDTLMHRDLSICIVRDKCFKKNLDTIEASRNMADFVDFKIKQCIKNKLGEVEMVEKMKDVFLILESLVATDSFLIYHQQLLGRRLIEPLNEPRIDIEKYIIRKIGDQLGSVTTNAHSYMIKDIEKSQQITENFSKKLPFARFKWTCRIISPQFWSDNINNNNLQMILPQALRLQADSIRDFYHQQFSRYLNWKIEKGFSLFQGKFNSGKFRFQSENIFLMLLFHISEGKGNQLYFWELLQKITKQKDGGTNYIMKCVKVLIENGLVVRSNPNNYEFSETELLRINTDFNPQGIKPNQTIMIKVSPQLMRAMHETSVENAKILKERQRVVEAVLVKILKTSHSTGNNRTTLEQLIRGVRDYQYLRNFQISEAVIKQKIQQIIGRGYCQRNEKDRKIYHYIA